MVNSGYVKHVTMHYQGRVPVQAKANNLQLDPIPNVFSTLNALERRLYR